MLKTNDKNIDTAKNWLKTEMNILEAYSNRIKAGRKAIDMLNQMGLAEEIKKIADSDKHLTDTRKYARQILDKGKENRIFEILEKIKDN